MAAQPGQRLQSWRLHVQSSRWHVRASGLHARVQGLRVRGLRLRVQRGARHARGWRLRVRASRLHVQERRLHARRWRLHAQTPRAHARAWRAHALAWRAWMPGVCLPVGGAGPHAGWAAWGVRGRRSSREFSHIFPWQYLRSAGGFHQSTPAVFRSVQEPPGKPVWKLTDSPHFPRPCKPFGIPSSGTQESCGTEICPT